MINVSWDDAQEYLAWLSQKTGHAYRLLSESEREYVTRAGTKTLYWWGSTISYQRANYQYYSNYEFRTKPPASVANFLPNPWGLYQVHGNVWEWVEDCWNESYLDKPSFLKASGAAWTSGNCNRRVKRGGSWESYEQFLGSGIRACHNRDLPANDTGFRVATSLD